MPAAPVLDEIQALQNPATLSANAARPLNADFRVDLTDTPVENNIVDLWAVMDQLTSLVPLETFATPYTNTPRSTLVAPHRALFVEGTKGQPPIASYRLKADVAADLPPRRRLVQEEPDETRGGWDDRGSASPLDELARSAPNLEVRAAGRDAYLLCESGQRVAPVALTLSCRAFLKLTKGKHTVCSMISLPMARRIRSRFRGRTSPGEC